ncbi:MAG: hypothetical protein PF439_07525 [Helicobacteraceae bacterium]|jgi:hypothetical protein|nr:hypothetical protein [Helicobacteraceae bacterium]
MLRITIKNGHLLKDGYEVELSQCLLSTKVKEVFQYLLNNHINFNFEKRDKQISFSAIRPDLKNRLINALMADKLIRHRGSTSA